MLSFEEIEEEVSTCRKCNLCETRMNTVLGEGNTESRILFIGEAPGKNEDEQGRPFVGAAGKYLDELLSIAGLERKDIYIANILKCRPPGNRDPSVDEIQTCTPYLRMQTKLIDPEYIVTLGNFATKFVLKTEKGITGLHGNVYKAGKFNVYPVFHPAAALYDSKKKIDLEEDFRHLGELLHQ